jgi:hypothetical protein
MSEWIDQLRADYERIAAPHADRPLPMTVELWVAERLRNALDIAETRKGEDRDGWIEDAIYHAIILRRLAQPCGLLIASKPQAETSLPESC